MFSTLFYFKHTNKQMPNYIMINLKPLSSLSLSVFLLPLSSFPKLNLFGFFFHLFSGCFGEIRQINLVDCFVFRRSIQLDRIARNVWRSIRICWCANGSILHLHSPSEGGSIVWIFKQFFCLLLYRFFVQLLANDG